MENQGITLAYLLEVKHVYDRANSKALILGQRYFAIISRRNILIRKNQDVFSRSYANSFMAIAGFAILLILAFFQAQNDAVYLNELLGNTVSPNAVLSWKPWALGIVLCLIGFVVAKGASKSYTRGELGEKQTDSLWWAWVVFTALYFLFHVYISFYIWSNVTQAERWVAPIPSILAVFDILLGIALGNAMILVIQRDWLILQASIVLKKHQRWTRIANEAKELYLIAQRLYDSPSQGGGYLQLPI